MDVDNSRTIPDNDTADEFLLAKEDTAYQMHKYLWKEFYDWEQQYCLQTLQGLEKPAVYPEEFPSEDLSDVDSFDSESLNEYSEWFTFETRDEQRTIYYEDALPLRLKLEEEGISPYPSYVACTPSSTNAQYPKNFMDKAPFTAFSDDPTFKRDKYLSLFNSFAWQTDFWDPDREMIFLETARRLHHGHGFSYLEIDNLQIHYVSLRLHGSAGMIWEVSQRDRLLWPGSQMSMLPDLTPHGAHSNLDLHEAVTKGIITFCDNLNCLRSACLAHDESHPIISPKPTMASKDLRSIRGTPCNRDCFKSYLGTDAEFELSTLSGSWDEKDLSVFSSVIKFAPDSSPCDLAVICRKPCVETYVQYFKYITDDNPGAAKEEITETLDMTFEEDLNLRPGFVLEDRVKQCYHPGACTQYSNCACYNSKQRCQRTCRCPKSCSLRFNGCECTGPKPCAEVDDCICQTSGRECDPELCTTCDARHSKGPGSRVCRNTMLQRGKFPGIWIHSSKFGLGAFALTTIKENKCIGDYVGEFVSGDIDAASDIIRKFLHRNYAFALSQTVSLDSYLLGNETRYLNHSKSANCHAKAMVVNGDVKIGVYAAELIKKDRELLLDYGDSYWNQPASEEEINSD